MISNKSIQIFSNEKRLLIRMITSLWCHDTEKLQTCDGQSYRTVVYIYRFIKRGKNTGTMRYNILEVNVQNSFVEKTCLATYAVVSRRE